MPTFTGRHTASHPVPLAPTAAAAAFADLDRWIACHPELAGAEKVDAATLKVRLKEMHHGPVAFAGHYTMHFHRAGEVVTWNTDDDGNLEVRGRAAFVPAAGGGSRMEFSEEVQMNLDLNRILAGVIRPVAETMMTRSMRNFAERMVEALGRLA